MKNLKELKEILNNLTEAQLQGNLVVIGNYTSGCVHEVKSSETNLYYLEEDDPSELVNEEDMKKRIEEKGETKLPKPYIKKGELILTF